MRPLRKQYKTQMGTKKRKYLSVQSPYILLHLLLSKKGLKTLSQMVLLIYNLRKSRLTGFPPKAD